MRSSNDLHFHSRKLFSMADNHFKRSWIWMDGNNAMDGLVISIFRYCLSTNISWTIQNARNNILFNYGHWTSFANHLRGKIFKIINGYQRFKFFFSNFFSMNSMACKNWKSVEWFTSLVLYFSNLMEKYHVLMQSGIFLSLLPQLFIMQQFFIICIQIQHNNHKIHDF